MIGEDVPPIPFNALTAYALEFTGDRARAAAIRHSLDTTPDTTWMVHYGRAFAYLATRDTSKVLSELEASLERRELVPQWTPLFDRAFDPIRHSARFAEIVRKAGLDGRGLTGIPGARP
jgi:hypothetical protein